MRIIRTKTKLSEIWNNREIQNTTLLKIVVDIKRRVIAVDAEMHADLENLLLDDGSKQEDLWGANLYPERGNTEFFEFTSFINIRPATGNRGMEINDPLIRDQVVSITNQLIEK